MQIGRKPSSRAVLRILWFSICGFVPLLAQVVPPAGERSPIRVELSAKKSAIYPGGRLTVRITIKNQGSETLFIPRDVSGVNERLILFLQHGSKREGPVSHAAGDNFFPIGQVPPFATLLSRYWIALEPGNFYGGEMVMDCRDYPRLRLPGRYLVKGTYRSYGFSENLRTFEEAISKLPFKAWEGQVETNAIWITVTKAPK